MNFLHGTRTAPTHAAGGAVVAAFDAARDLVFVVGPNGVDALGAADGMFRFALPKNEVEGRIDESDLASLRIGMEMEVVVVPFMDDEQGNEVVTYAFRPVRSGSER